MIKDCIATFQQKFWFIIKKRHLTNDNSQQMFWTKTVILEQVEFQEKSTICCCPKPIP